MENGAESAARTVRPVARLSPDGEEKQVRKVMLEEHALAVTLDGQALATILCSRTDLRAMVLGRLFTEGFISGAEDVEKLEVSEDETSMDVRLRPGLPAGEPGKLINSCNAVSFLPRRAPAKVTPIPWKREWVLDLERRMSSGTPLFRATRGSHSCFLSVEGECLFTTEDIGRHNALDKAVGLALLAGTDLKRAMLFSSGRLPADMVTKAIRAGVPVLASKAVVTAQGAALAREYDLTLLGSVRRGRIEIYNDPGTDQAGAGAKGERNG